MPTNIHIVKAMVFPIVMYGCEKWTIKKAECLKLDAFKSWCWRRLFRVPWKARRSNQSILKKKNQPWTFIGRTDAEAEAPIFWPPDVKSQLTGKDPDAGKGWRQKEKGATEDEMVGWHHRLEGHEFEQAPGDSEDQGSLVWCSPRRSRKGWTQLSDWKTKDEINWTRQCARLCLGKLLQTCSAVGDPGLIWKKTAKNTGEGYRHRGREDSGILITRFIYAVVWGVVTQFCGTTQHGV